MRTNSDLYQAVANLGESEAARARPLAEYLRAFWSVGCDFMDRTMLTPIEMVGMIEAAITEPAPSFEEQWLREDLTEDVPGFAGWARVVRAQVCDLHEMTAAGLYNNPSRYHGVDAPRPYGAGSRLTPVRWLNFEVPTYLEAGVDGAFGGWRPEFDGASAGVTVEGVMTDGRLIEGVTVERDRPNPTPLGKLTWDDLTRFARCGQTHE